MDERRRVNEFHDGGVQNRAIALVPREACGHEQHGRTNPLAAARLDVLADFRDQIDVRLHVPAEFAIDLLEVDANRLEDLRESGQLFHSELEVYDFITAGTTCGNWPWFATPARRRPGYAARRGWPPPDRRRPARCACRDAGP